MEKRFGVISADGHCRLMHLPFDLWTKRLPRRLQDSAPRVVQGPDGTRQWVVEGRVWSGVKRQVFFTFEVEEEGGFRRVPEVGVKNFLWASDFPGLDSPWPRTRERWGTFRSRPRSGKRRSSRWSSQTR